MKFAILSPKRTMFTIHKFRGEEEEETVILKIPGLLFPYFSKGINSTI